MTMTTYAMTASSQVKSANAVTDIKFHSGKENRATFAHENKNIVQTRSHLNVEIDVYSREDLLERHYGDLVRKHDKHNNSASRRYGSVEGYLKKFEGTKVRGIEGNERWSTLCQITYVGDKDTISELFNDLVEAGASEEEVLNAYSAGYRAYVDKHNEAFPMLPIYHSDIHFDETTPHGHDAIVVMGHTEKGKPTDSLNTALGEKYGYRVPNKERLAKYREENDQLAFDSVLGALQVLGEAYDMPFDVEMVRTGQTYSLDMHGYQVMKDELEEAVAEREKELDVKEKALKGRSLRLEKREEDVERKEAAVAQQEADLTGREARLKEKEAELAELERKRVAREADLERREKDVFDMEQNQKALLNGSFANGIRYGVEALREIAGPDDKYKVLKTANIDVLIRASSYPLIYTDSEGVSGEHSMRKRYNDASKLLKARERNQAKQETPGANSKQQTQSATSQEVER